MLTRWNKPAHVFNLLDRVLDNEFHFTAGSDTFKSVPAVNISEDEDNFTLDLAAPGLSKEDFKIEINDRILSISAEQKTESETDEKKFRRKEFSYTTFKRSFRLPKLVNGDAIEARYEDGVLSLQIPKLEEAKPKRKEIAVS